MCVSVDIQPPVLTLPNDVPGQPVDAGRPDAVVAWSSLPTAVDAWESTLNLIVVCEDQAGNVVTSGDRYPVGLTTVTCRANDTSMNEASDQFTITVIGKLPLWRGVVERSSSLDPILNVVKSKIESYMDNYRMLCRVISQMIALCPFVISSLQTDFGDHVLGGPALFFFFFFKLSEGYIISNKY